jgi:hypothetical protein
LEGVPLGPTMFGTFGDADTLIRRTADPFDRCSLPSLSPVDVSIEIVALNLVSSSPITVTYNGGNNPELWDVTVDLSMVPAPQGNMTVTKTHCNGGTFTSTLLVQPRFTFTKVGGGGMQVLDTGLAVPPIPPINLDQPMPQPWVHDVGIPFNEDLDPCSDFHAGFNDGNQVLYCDCNGNTIRDQCDIESGFSQDCNANNRPDSCDIGLGYSADANMNMIPDECDGPPIPAASDWMVIALVMALLAAGTIVFAARRRAATA